MNFEDYKIHVGQSSNYKGKYVAYLEEFHNVSEIIDDENQAEEKLRPLFKKEVKRLRECNEPIPLPGSGKAKIRFASNEKLESLRPFVDEFWINILGVSYSASFVSDNSQLFSWDHYVEGGKEELIRKVKRVYGIDISKIYDRPIFEILKWIIDNS